MTRAQDGESVARIAVWETDLFFAVKIQDILKRAGYVARVARTGPDFASLLRDGGYTLGLVDFAARGVDWRAGIQSAREVGAPVIAYGPHVDLETQTEARAAGASRVIANSRLGELPAIIGRVLSGAVSRGEPEREHDGVPQTDTRAGD